jgi:hypothetical protein
VSSTLWIEDAMRRLRKKMELVICSSQLEGDFGKIGRDVCLM